MKFEEGDKVTVEKSTEIAIVEDIGPYDKIWLKSIDGSKSGWEIRENLTKVECNHHNTEFVYSEKKKTMVCPFCYGGE